MKKIMLGLLTWFVITEPALACGSCFGNPDDPQTKGVQAAILVMLAVTYATIVGLIAFFVWFLKRKRPINPSTV